MTQLGSFLHFLKLKPTSIRLQIEPIECIEYQVWKHMQKTVWGLDKISIQSSMQDKVQLLTWVN